MSELIKIDAVEPLDGCWLRLTFSDGAVKDVDVGEILGGGAVLSAIREDRAVFEQIRVNPETRTIQWRGDVDLDPEVLHGRFEPGSGVTITSQTVSSASSGPRLGGVSIPSACVSRE